MARAPAPPLLSGRAAPTAPPSAMATTQVWIGRGADHATTVTSTPRAAVRSASRSTRKRRLRRDQVRALVAELRAEQDPKRRDRLREALITEHLALAEYLVARFRDKGEPYEDLLQVAMLGLVKAIDRYEPGAEAEFVTYATPVISGELKRYLRDKGWGLRVPRRIKDLYVELNALVSELGQELGRSPTVQELAEHAKVTEEEVIEALDSSNAYRWRSLEAPIDPGDGGAGQVGDLVGNDDRELSKCEWVISLAPEVAKLPERERSILKMRFFEDLTQSEIAERLGISQMHVSRLLARSMARLRDALLAGA